MSLGHGGNGAAGRGVLLGGLNRDDLGVVDILQILVDLSLGRTGLVDDVGDGRRGRDGKGSGVAINHVPALITAEGQRGAAAALHLERDGVVANQAVRRRQGSVIRQRELHREFHLLYLDAGSDLFFKGVGNDVLGREVLEYILGPVAYKVVVTEGYQRKSILCDLEGIEPSTAKSIVVLVERNAIAHLGLDEGLHGLNNKGLGILFQLIHVENNTPFRGSLQMDTDVLLLCTAAVVAHNPRQDVTTDAGQIETIVLGVPIIGRGLIHLLPGCILIYQAI